MLILAIRKAQKVHDVDKDLLTQRILDTNNSHDASFMKAMVDVRMLLLRLREMITYQSHDLTVRMLNRFIWIDWHYLKVNSDMLCDQKEPERRSKTRAVSSCDMISNNNDALLEATVNNRTCKVKVSVRDDDLQMACHTAAAIIPSAGIDDRKTWRICQKLCYLMPTAQTFMQLSHERSFNELFKELTEMYEGCGLHSSKAAAHLQMACELVSMGNLDNAEMQYLLQMRSKKTFLIGNEREGTKQCLGVPCDAHVLRLIITNFAERVGINVIEKQRKNSKWSASQRNFAMSIGRLLPDDVVCIANTSLVKLVSG